MPTRPVAMLRSTLPILVRLGALSLICLLASCAMQAPDKPIDVPKKDDPAVAEERRLQEDLAARAHLAGYRRMQRVAYPVMRAAAANCVDRRRLAIGVSPVDGEIFPKNLQPAAVRIGPFGKARPLVFLAVLPGTPAYDAGIRESDVLVSVAGKPVLSGAGSMELLEQDIHEQALKAGKVSIEVLRKGANMKFDVGTEWVCRQRFVFDGQDTVNAMTLFDTTIVLAGVSRVMSSDDELTMVLAHELAHSLLRHSEATVNYARYGRTLSDAEHQQREQDADALGLRLAALAGVDVSQAEDVFRRLGQAMPGSISTATSHPTTPERMVAIRRLVAELSHARQNGESIFADQSRYRSYFGESLPIDENAVKELAKKLPFMESPVRKTLGSVARSFPRSDDPRLSDWTNVPALNVQGRVAYQQWLLDEHRPRVFALSASGTWGSGFGPQASEQALAACREHAQDSVCYVYAQDMKRVLSEADEAAIRKQVAAQTPRDETNPQLFAGHTRMPPADSGFAPLADVDAVPVRASNRKAYADYLKRSSPKAFAVKANGGFRFAAGAADAMERVLADCERAGEVCWLYAVDEHVVWQRDVDARIGRVNQLKRAEPMASAQSQPLAQP